MKFYGEDYMDPARMNMDSASMLPGASQSGSNQYFGNLPTIPAFNSPMQSPGVVPPAGGGGMGMGGNLTPQAHSIAGGIQAVGPLDPGLTSQLFQYLSSQIGQGASPFNLQSVMPSSGDVTQAGQLSAPNNQLLQQLFQGLMSGKTDMPGLSRLLELSQGGASGPINDAAQRTIAEQAANLREQFAFSGNLASSPFGGAMTDFYNQSAKDLNAQMLPFSAQAAQSIFGAQQNTGQFMQQLDQASIDRLLQEFVRTRPENNPLMGAMMGAATTFPKVVQTKSNFDKTMEVLSFLLGGAKAGGDIFTGLNTP